MPPLATTVSRRLSFDTRLRVVLSASQDVHWNLGLEDALFRRLQQQQKGAENRSAARPADAVALIYRNQPCVVIGLHQNPWLECRVREAQLAGVPVVRRLSGGGAVYHDLGNWNLSFITPRAWHNREANDEFVRRLCARLAGPGKEVTVGKRHDVYCQGLKVSGSAAKVARGAAYHHFCILLSADLTRLGRFLGSDLPLIATNATASVRSGVANLMADGALVGDAVGKADTPLLLDDAASSQMVLAAVNEELAVHNWAIAGGAAASAPLCVDPRALPPDIAEADVLETADKLRSWEWVFGRTPAFQCHLPPPSSLTLSVQKGHVTELLAGQASGLASQLRSFLIGQPCRASVLLPVLDAVPLDPAVARQLAGVFTSMGH